MQVYRIALRQHAHVDGPDEFASPRRVALEQGLHPVLPGDTDAPCDGVCQSVAQPGTKTPDHRVEN